MTTLDIKNIDENGCAWVAELLSAAECVRLKDSIGQVSGAGRRGLLSTQLVSELAHSGLILALLRPHLPHPPIPVRAIYFDKSPDANWLVPWHQDLTIAVSGQREQAGWGPWSVKDGIPHVQPPITLMEQMLAVRLHLDDCDETNGALRVLPGTHKLGRLSAEAIQTERAQREEFVCCAGQGDALLMRPLLLHASGRSQSDRRRRILHLEYAGFSLPEFLDWHQAA